MFQKSIYDKSIPPACEYCVYGRTSSDKDMILCRKKGVVSPFSYCKKYTYDPIMRIPKRMPKMRKFTASDFSLD